MSFEEIKNGLKHFSDLTGYLTDSNIKQSLDKLADFRKTENLNDALSNVDNNAPEFSIIFFALEYEEMKSYTTYLQNKNKQSSKQNLLKLIVKAKMEGKIEDLKKSEYINKSIINEQDLQQLKVLTNTEIKDFLK